MIITLVTLYLDSPLHRKSISSTSMVPYRFATYATYARTMLKNSLHFKIKWNLLGCSWVSAMFRAGSFHWRQGKHPSAAPGAWTETHSDNRLEPATQNATGLNQGKTEVEWQGEKPAVRPFLPAWSQARSRWTCLWCLWSLRRTGRSGTGSTTSRMRTPIKSNRNS